MDDGDEPAVTPTVHLISSSGGHIELLFAVRSAFTDYRRLWLLQPSHRAKTLLEMGERVKILPQYDRHPIRGHFAQNVATSLATVAKERPRVVVTTGAGITVPFCAFARLSGAKLIFLETMARVTGPGASGKALSRMATRSLVQWPEALPEYPRARLCNPPLLEDVDVGSSAGGVGTCVAVGTHSQPFDRLLRMVDEATAAGLLPKPVIAQTGVSDYRPRHFQGSAFFSPDEVERLVLSSRVVISHGGSGMISSALRAGRKPLVLPRLARHGEHFDDHQEQLVSKLSELGLVVSIPNGIGPSQMAEAAEPLPAIETSGAPSVIDAVRNEVDSAFRISAAMPATREPIENHDETLVGTR